MTFPAIVLFQFFSNFGSGSISKGKKRIVFILFKYLLQLMLYMLHILVDGDLLNRALLI